MKNAAIVALLCIALYFAIFLPMHDRAKLQLEREKFKQQEKVRQEKERADSERHQEIEKAKDQARTNLLDCRAVAEQNYGKDLKLNGAPVPAKKDTYRGPTSLFDQLEKKQREEDAACQRQYELDLKAAEQK